MISRRKFLWVFATVGAGGLVAYFWPRFGLRGMDAASRPPILGQICSAKELSEIGKIYLKDFPHENDPTGLSDLILKDGKKSSGNEKNLEKLLKDQTQKDFVEGRIVVIRGWVLSLTEARQCALYFLTHS